MASSQALAKRAADTALMPPPPAPKRRKRPPEVLSEEAYMGALNYIITRDFFPELLETQAKLDFLAAVESKDRAWIEEAGRNLTEVQTPAPDGRRGSRAVSMTPTRSLRGETPRNWRGETPMSAAGTETDEEKLPDINLNMSLTAFQAKYICEDTADYHALACKMKAELAAKKSWLYNGNKLETRLQIEDRERQARIQDAGNSDNQLMLPSKDADTRPAMPDSRREKPFNALMFYPESIEDTQITTAQAAEAASNAPPKAIKYENTRFRPPSPETEDLVPPSPSMSAIDAAIGGRPRGTTTDPGYDGAETPLVNGYSFVGSEVGTPVPEPELDEHALLARLGKADPSPNPFTIQEQSKREELRDAMVEKHARTKKQAASGGLGGWTPLGGRTPTTPRIGSAPNLTPSGLALLKKAGAATPRRSSWAFREQKSSGLKRMRTPMATPKRKT